MQSQNRATGSGYESPDEQNAFSTTGYFPARNFASDPEKAVSRQGTVLSPSSLDNMITRTKGVKGAGKVGLRDRIACHQWTWFTMTMVCD